MTQSYIRELPARTAATLAVAKIKANLEQVRDWDANESAEASSKLSVSNQIIQNPEADNRSVTSKASAENGEIAEGRANRLSADASDDQRSESSQSKSNSGTVATLVSSTDDASTTDFPGCTHGLKPNFTDRMTLSDLRRWERAEKARARKQHSAQRMFLSRRLSRKMRGCSSPSSPIFSPLVAKTLLFSPELTSIPKTKKVKRAKPKKVDNERFYVQKA